MDLVKINDEVTAMRKAVAGDGHGEYFHRFNWEDKPHRVVSDACRIIEAITAEITQLRAELEQERDMADRMYGALEYIDDYCLAYPELESISAVSSSAIEYVDTRRNK